jgi:hypothetical protein
MIQKLLLACLVLLLPPKPNSGQSTLQSHTYRLEDLTSQKEANATFGPILDGMTGNGVHLHVHEVFSAVGKLAAARPSSPAGRDVLISEGEVP